jgi:hypothetical protein
MWGVLPPKYLNTMNTRTRIFLAGAALVAGCAFAGPAIADTVDTTGAAPAPSQASVWMGGHWDSVGGQWKWVAAHWEQPPSSSATWVAGHWVPQAGKWAWVNGAWNVGDPGQTQSGPPQPPASPGSLQDSPAQLENGPEPTSAAPYVDGQYGPGGVTRVADQGEVVTDYGPDYYSSYGYPYAYDAYPWGWGWGAPFFAVGFGGRVGGYGHYGYGHYGHGGYGHGGSGGHFSHGSSGGGHFGGAHH